MTGLKTEMLTDSEIKKLISMPKEITNKPSTKASNCKDHRTSLVLESISPRGNLFSVFIRQHADFIEGFSIGLLYQTGDKKFGKIPLIRYNGPHGEYSRPKDGHVNKPHIHRMTSKELHSGSTHPEPKDKEITNKYNTFDEALIAFFKDVKIENYKKYFPNAHQMTIFNEHSKSD